MSIHSRIGILAAAASAGGGGGGSGSTPTINALGGNSEGTASQTLTWNHTVGSGSNRLLIVSIAYNGTGNFSGVTNPVTYGGTPMTSLSHATSGGASADRAVDVYYLVAPTSGTAAVLVTFNAAAIPSGCSGESMDYTSVFQSAPFGIPATTATASTGSTISTTVTTAATNIILAFLGYQLGTAATYTTGSQIFTARLAGTNCMLQGSSQAGGTSVASTFGTTSAVHAATLSVALVGA